MIAAALEEQMLNPSLQRYVIEKQLPSQKVSSKNGYQDRFGVLILPPRVFLSQRVHYGLVSVTTSTRVNDVGMDMAFYAGVFDGSCGSAYIRSMPLLWAYKSC